MAANVAVLAPAVPRKEEITVLPLLSPTQGKIQFPETKEIRGTGWLPDMPDLRDFKEDHPEVKRMLNKMKIPVGEKLPVTALPPAVDLRPFCSQIRDQKNLGSCTAFAASGIIEYLENVAFGKHIDTSPLFTYKTTRHLLGLAGDTGATLRSTMASLVYFGTPPEKYWPYTDNQMPGPAGTQQTFDDEPGTFIYEIADNYESVSYFCLDPFGVPTPPATLLDRIKTYVAAKLPIMFGFWVFPTAYQTNLRGAFAFPAPRDRAVAGHAVDIVGYDDNLSITNLVSNQSTVGAFLIRNSWGTQWGNAGYGYLPYQYVLAQFASDFWCVTGMKWVDTGKFGL